MNARLPSRPNRRLVPLLVVAGTIAVGILSYLDSRRPVHVYPHEPFPRKLSSWHLFTGTSDGLRPNTGVLPYDLNTPLFSDYAAKYRFVWMPPGTSATYNSDSVFDFPIGTILAKTFAFPIDGHPKRERLVETRLLVHTDSGWVALPYIWNQRPSEAYLQLVPDPVPIRFTDSAGHTHNFTYQIPNVNECRLCHDHNNALEPIGPQGPQPEQGFFIFGWNREPTVALGAGGLPQRPASSGNRSSVRRCME